MNRFYVQILLSSLLIIGCDSQSLNHSDNDGHFGKYNCDLLRKSIISADCLNSIEFHHLVDHVQFHNLNSLTIDTSRLIIRPIGFYYYSSDTIILDTSSAFVRLSGKELKAILQDVEPSAYLNNHSIVKINSKIAFVWNPDLLKEYTIRLVDFNKHNSSVVSGFLKGIGFSKIEVDSMQENQAIINFLNMYSEEELDSSIAEMYEGKTEWLRFIHASYENDNLNFEYSDSLVNEIRKHPLIDTAYILDVYSGKYENERFFEIKNNAS